MIGEGKEEADRVGQGMMGRREGMVDRGGMDRLEMRTAGPRWEDLDLDLVWAVAEALHLWTSECFRKEKMHMAARLRTLSRPH